MAIESERERGTEEDYTRIMLKQKLKFFDIFKQALTIPCTTPGVPQHNRSCSFGVNDIYRGETSQLQRYDGFLTNCYIMVRSFDYHAYVDVLLTIVRGVGFTFLLVKLLEWSAGWNMALVISILEEKYGIEALEWAAYMNRDCSQRGLILMLVFFAWGLTIRLSCIFYGCSDELATGSVLFTSIYTCLICLGNAMKWVICVVYFFDCKKGISEKKVDDEEVGRDVKLVDH
ncbi:hypothetical protein QQP08_006773 [Theobroma cacao]|nr:hypothetical protein QQP08_006387 [Theobroma cacao]WRX14286.1 hypothetical protein QQP08_006773 [Theobroma cacao]